MRAYYSKESEEIYMNIVVLEGLFIPFIGTSLGSAMVFFMRHEINKEVQRILDL